MKNSVTQLTLIIAFISILYHGCEKSENSNENTNPLLTDKGTPSGTKTATSIGTTGGSIESSDGYLLVSIPSGALTAATNISVEPITNEAPLGLGKGYRLLPEGTTFSKPIKLTFHFNENILDGTLPEFLWIVTQANDGSWNAALKSTVDKYAKTITIETTHFSDWALGKFIDFVLEPSSKTIQKGQSVQFKLSGFSRDKAIDEDELVPLIPITGDGDGLTPLTPIPTIESRLMDFRVKQWTMNGATAPVSNNNGKLNASGISATYTAPNKKPDINPVAITVKLEANNKEGGKASYMITSNISVVESDYYLLVKIDGASYEYYQYGFNGAIPPDPNNISGANCGLTDDNILGIIGVNMTNSSDFINGFSLEIKNPAVTTRSLVGFNKDGDDDMNFQTSALKPYLLDYTKYSYDAAHDICNTDYECGNASVTILTYNDNEHIVRGYFSGTLYEESTSDNWKNCKTPNTHTVVGEFRLIVSNLYFGE